MNQALTLPSIGDVVDGKFRIDRKLGEGGTSTVYEVQHVITDKKFAIKWLAPELSHNELAVERFIHEARVCGRFAHPHAVQIYDICRTNASFYLLMELLEGESLEARLQRVKRFSIQAACDILLPCIEAVGAAHRVGIVHRDLKPSNIFLCRVEGRAGEVPKVLDFGISKLSFNGYDLSPVTTNTRTVIGTPLYMAPEQMRGQSAEPRFDIYALGIVLYELIAGQAPFDCDTFADLVVKVLEAQPLRLDLVADVAPEFGAIVARAIAGEAEDRFATMAELAQALLPYSSQRAQVASEVPKILRPSVALAPMRRTLSADAPFVRKLALVETPEPAAAPMVAPVPMLAPAANASTPHPPASAALAAPRLVPALGANALPIPVDDEPRARVSRSAARRWLAVTISLGLALFLAWHTRAGAPRISTASSGPADLRPRALEPEPSPLPSVPAAPDAWIETARPVLIKPKHRQTSARSPKATESTTARAGRQTSRARGPRASAREQQKVDAQPTTTEPTTATANKRRATLSDSSLRIERSDFNEPEPSLAPPAVELSRQDF